MFKHIASMNCSLIIFSVIVCSVLGYETVKKQCFCVIDYPTECALISGLQNGHILLTKVLDKAAALYWLNKIERAPPLACKLNSKRFLDIASGDHYSVGLGYQHEMGVIHGHYNFGHVDVHGYVGGNPLTNNYGGGIGVTIPLGK